MIRLIKPTKTSLKGILFIYVFDNTDNTGIRTFQDNTILVSLSGDFLSAQSDVDGQITN